MNIMTKSLVICAIALSSLSANAANFTVEAQAHSFSGGSGTGLSTINLSAGQQFSVSVDPNDLWSAGGLPRWSNANGLTGNLFSTGLADSNGDLPSTTVGQLIGQNFGLPTFGGLTAPYGMLVGQIGSGNVFAIGTSFSGIASSAGMLKLYYFDSNSGDNFGSIVANVSSVPLPGAAWLFISVIGGMAVSRRKATA